MKREIFISVVAVVHGIWLVLGGAWPLVDMRSYELVTGPEMDHWAVRAVGGMSLFLGMALFWCVRRGVVEAPIRLLAAGCSGTLGMVALIPALQGMGGHFHLIEGALHLLFALCWTAILLTSDSPYRPRPVMSSKKLRQKL